MEKYWENHPQSTPSTGTPMNDEDIQVTGLVMSDFDQYRQGLIANEDDEDGSQNYSSI